MRGRWGKEGERERERERGGGGKPTIRKLYGAVSVDGRWWEGFRPRASTEGVFHQTHFSQSFLHTHSESKRDRKESGHSDHRLHVVRVNGFKLRGISNYRKMDHWVQYITGCTLCDGREDTDWL